MTQTSIKRRRGFSLFEVLVSISASSILFLVAVGWIHQTMKFASATRDLDRHHQNLISLGSRLRDDVHRSRSIEMDGKETLIVHFANGDFTSYQISETVVRCEQNVLSDKSHVERLPDPSAPVRQLPIDFTLSTKCLATWDVSQMPQSISLIVFRRDPNDIDLPIADWKHSRTFTEMPIDFQVRVSPNRWKTEWSVSSNVSAVNSHERP